MVSMSTTATPPSPISRNDPLVTVKPDASSSVAGSEPDTSDSFPSTVAGAWVMAAACATPGVSVICLTRSGGMPVGPP